MCAFLTTRDSDPLPCFPIITEKWALCITLQTIRSSREAVMRASWRGRYTSSGIDIVLCYTQFSFSVPYLIPSIMETKKKHSEEVEELNKTIDSVFEQLPSLCQVCHLPCIVTTSDISARCHRSTACAGEEIKTRREYDSPFMCS